MNLQLPPCYFLGFAEIQEQSQSILQVIPSNKSLQYVERGEKHQSCYIKLEGDHFREMIIEIQSGNLCICRQINLHCYVMAVKCLKKYNEITLLLTYTYFEHLLAKCAVKVKITENYFENTIVSSECLPHLLKTRAFKFSTWNR